MNVNIQRIKRRIEKMASFNATPQQGITRFSFSKEDMLAREYLMNEMHRLGLKILVDSVGNIHGRLNGRKDDAKPVLTGSHIDSVRHGGIFDGITGSMCSLEVVTLLIENDIIPTYPVEIIFFAEEEGSNFDSTMLGSKSIAGKYSVVDLKQITNSQGTSCYSMLKDFGLNPDSLPDCVIKKGDFRAMLELHVEQGGVLDHENIPIGIVKAIFGSQCLQVTLEGEPNHAGATPMVLRHDPMVAAADIIMQLEEFTRNNASKATVATVGKFSVSPDTSNCIPGVVQFTVDVRDSDPVGINAVLKALNDMLFSAEKKYGIKSSIKTLAHSDIVQLSPKVMSVIEEAAKAKKISYKVMDSGAVHDSAMLTQLTDVGMIFVPSIGGRSHVPEENTNWEDIKLGCELLLESILKISDTNI